VFGRVLIGTLALLRAVPFPLVWRRRSAGIALGTGALRFGSLDSASVNELLADHVSRFNQGVQTGEWHRMLASFHEGAEMEFRGIPVGPFVGKDAIAAAYDEQPPDDELRVLEERERDGRVEARYAWLRDPHLAAGEILITPRDGKIMKLVVTFDRGVVWSDA
jgi:steroid delta-isomerase